MELLTQPETYIAFLTLTALEIVLGIDNIIFLTILAGKMPERAQRGARRLGIGVAVVSRVLLLCAISWVMRLQEGWFTVLGKEISGKDLILIVGGLFLMGKAVTEIYENVEHPESDHVPDVPGNQGATKPRISWRAFLLQVVVLDVVFSLDSVITAVGMVDHPAIMVAAVICAAVVMVVFAGPIGDFVQERASVRVLALSFLVLIGFLLIAEGFDQHVSKAYVYFAMAFSLLVELLNMRMRTKVESKQTAGGV